MDREYRPLHITATGTGAPVGNNVSTTAPDTLTAGADRVVTPVSMANITVGRLLNFNGGTGAAEDVVVKAVTSTTFTVDFVNGHSGAYKITSCRVVDLGNFVVNDPGTTVTVTLYDGHPSASPAGTVIAVIKPAATDNTRVFSVRCNRGLFYTLAGTPGDYTITHHDRSA